MLQRISGVSPETLTGKVSPLGNLSTAWKLTLIFDSGGGGLIGSK